MNHTIAAISTNNLGIGAINIIRLSGDEAISIVSEIFTNKKFKNADTHTIHYGYIKDKNKVLDEVLVTLMRAPRTYTKEDIVEINCHGGYASTNAILELLLKKGAVLAEPGEFTKRAFLNGRINLLEAESIEDLIEAKSTSASTMALNGVRGKTTKLIQDLREDMVRLLSNIEVNIDYPEYLDELQITKENITPVLSSIKKKLTKIVEEAENGKYIKNGIQIAIIGRPNVGKSSLLNALLEEEKAIVTDISGTTRDIVEGSIFYKGIEYHFIDTAGIRETEDIVEKIGVEKSKEMIEKADITILVFNASEEFTKSDKELLTLIQNKKALIFVNKTDLEIKLSTPDMDKTIILGSTLTGKGIEELKEEILKSLALNDLSTKNLTYLSNARQVSLAKSALDSIDKVIQANQENIPVDMLAIDIKSAWEALGNIIGESYDDELVDNIFARFCLGK
ncbi:MAG: tRNA uridine-5-carboxymethylaminomethyl(34) synthesis GTPase MnmE [Bacilli bacterium]|nr:tRNA uridine-5-carboxymethylaminomethyl(34) synthesis GTPase MnmE [Bacilli bacterium]MBR1817865.1 tRNA uridine-5-carboxymethylaminomethyl(34) synthesis GTPase MnmE [Bacilli bacterium]